MPKRLKPLILTADKFEDMELFFPYFRLLEEGLEVDIMMNLDWPFVEEVQRLAQWAQNLNELFHIGF